MIELLPRRSIAAFFKLLANCIHTIAIGSQVGITDARCRAKMNLLALCVEREFGIVNESKQWAGEFRVKIGVSRFHHFRSWHLLDELAKVFHRVGCTSAESNWLHPATSIVRTRMDTVFYWWTWKQMTFVNTQVAWFGGGPTQTRQNEKRS
jgi:hypothetical protein